MQRKADERLNANSDEKSRATNHTTLDRSGNLAERQALSKIRYGTVTVPAADGIRNVVRGHLA